MGGRIRLKTGLLLAGLLSVAAFSSIGCGRHGIRLATDFEIKAVLPKELLDKVPVDSEARARYEKLTTLAKSLTEKDAYLIDEPDRVINDSSKSSASNIKDSKDAGSSLKNEEAVQYGLAKWILSSHPRLISDISDLLATGPVQAPIDQPFKTLTDDDFAVMRFIRTVTRCAEWYEYFGKYRTCTDLLSLCINLTERLFSDQGSFTAYMLASMDEGIVDYAVSDVATDPTFPVDNCKFLLAASLPAPKVDEFAAASVLVEFQSSTLKRLLNPLKSDDPMVPLAAEDKAGTFDAIETAKMCGKAGVAALTNARNPMPYFDASTILWIDQKTKGLPQPLLRDSDDAAKQAYCDRMNAIDNSIGLSILKSFHTLGMLPSISCGWRANRDAVRVLLATRIYRSVYGGNLPESSAELLPFLGEWPQDPYSIKPMIYAPKEERIYGVAPSKVPRDKSLAALSAPPGPTPVVMVSLALKSRNK